MRMYAVLANVVLTSALVSNVHHGRKQEPLETAESSAHAAVTAAHVANQVATHAGTMHEHARQALKHAQNALHGAQSHTEGLTAQQQESLSKADAELTIATEKVQTEQLESVEYMEGVRKEVAAAEQSHQATERLREDLARLRAKIAAADSAELEAELASLEAQLKAAEAAELRYEGSGESLGRMNDDLEQLQRQIDTMEDIKQLNSKLTKVDESVQEEHDLRGTSDQIKQLIADLEAAKAGGASVDQQQVDDLGMELQKLKQAVADAIAKEQAAKQAAAHDFEPLVIAPAGSGAISPPFTTHPATNGKTLEINTEMPYGELEPFGREDTAQELTEASIAESDRMVDQIEKAEIAEEKRAVFRSLTRLRGAAITSFDGVARSQTGNIDEYAHTHQWRGTHPLHHLADEESDVSKWAFPKDAD